MMETLYLHTAAYAKEHGELEAYRSSTKANMACKEAIEGAIAAHYRDNCLDAAGARKVVEKFGMERVQHILALTVQEKDWDGRISRDNKAWAKTIPILDDRNNCSLVVDRCHPGLANLFLDQVRQIAKEREPQKDRKPSVLKKFREVSAEPRPESAPNRGREGER